MIVCVACLQIQVYNKNPGAFVCSRAMLCKWWTKMLVVHFSCFDYNADESVFLFFSPCIKSSVWFCSVILDIGSAWIFIIHPPTSILSKQLPQNLKFQNISKTEANNLQIFLWQISNSATPIYSKCASVPTGLNYATNW